LDTPIFEVCPKQSSLIYRIWSWTYCLLLGLSNADKVGLATDTQFTTSNCVFVGRNHISWKSKNQPAVSRSSIESERRAIANTCEMVWIRDLPSNLHFMSSSPMRLYCDNKADMHIAENLVFYEHAEHIDVDCYLVGQKVDNKILEIRHISSINRLAYSFDQTP